MQAGGGTITLDEYLFYGDQPIEVVEGRVILVAPAAGQPRAITRLLRRLERYVRKSRSGELLLAASYVLDGDPQARTVRLARTPDLSLIRLERIEAYTTAHPGQTRPWWLAPDWAVEVASPTDRYDETGRRVTDYLRCGVRLVWAIDPSAREVRIYSPDEPLGHNVFGADLLTAEPIIPGWAMEAEAVFGR